MPHDPKHGRFIPSGRALYATIRPLLSTEGKRMRKLFLAGRGGDISTQWQQVLNESVYHQLLMHYQAGRKIAARTLKAVRTSQRQKAADWLPIYRVEMGVSQPVELAAQQLALDLSGGLSDSLRQQMRDTIGSGMAGGFSASEISEAFERMFGPQRAMTIAVTEASRAQHAGEMDVYREMGIEEHSWLSSADACEKCKSLDGTIVAIGDAFHVHEGGRSAYRMVLHPPLHPVCKCTVIPAF